MGTRRRRVPRMLAALAIGLQLVAPVSMASADSVFVDVPEGHLFQGDIEWLAAAGITRGCNPPDNDHYCPNQPVTRAQMAAFLVRALDLTDDGGGNTFTDDDGSIFEDNIAKLAAAGITRGCNPPDNDHYCPNQPVTRAQMAAFLRRALEDTTPPAIDVDTVVDGEEVDTSGAGTGTGSFLLAGTTSPDTVSVTVSAAGESAAALLDTAANPPKWEIDVSAPTSGLIEYTITATDAAGNTTSETITVDVTLPDPDEVVLDPDVVVVDGPLAAALAAYDAASGRIEFTGDLTGEIGPGSVLVGGPFGGIAPRGLMHRVVTVTLDSGTTVIMAEPAEIAEVLRQDGLGLSTSPVLPAAFRSQQAALEGSHIQGWTDGKWGLALGGTIDYDRTFQLPAQPAASVHVAGQVQAQAEFNIDIDCTFLAVNCTVADLKIEASGAIAGSTSYTATASAEFSDTQTLYSQDLGAGWLGPIPVTLEGEFIGEVSASATAEGSITGTYDVGFIAGAERINGAMVPYSSFPRDGSFDVAATAELEASVGLKLQLEFLLADAAGPNVVIGPELVATALVDLINRIIPWQVRVDLVADLGITGQIPIFGTELFDESWELWRGELAVLAEGTLILPGAAISIDKALVGNDDLDQSGGVSAGDSLTYEIVLSNSGTQTVTNASISDPLVTTPSCVPAIPVATFDPGETIVCSGDYTVTKSDVTAGTIYNTALGTALDSGGGTLIAESSVATPTQAPILELTVDKSLSNADEDGSGGITENDTLTYTIDVTNTGNLRLVSISVDDPLLPGLVCDTVTALYPGESTSCTGDYIVTIDDVNGGAIENTASARGYNSYWGWASGSDDLISPAQTPNPSLWMRKWLVANADEDGSGDMTPGDTLTFGVTVANNGTTALTTVTVLDPSVTGFICSPTPPTDLAIGESISCSGTYVVTQQDYDDRYVTNTATANGLDPDLNVVAISDSATVERTKPYVEEVLAGNPSAYWRMGGDTLDSVGPFHATAGHQPFSTASFVGSTNDGAMDLGCCDIGGDFDLTVGEATLASDDFALEMWIASRHPEIGYTALSMDTGPWYLSVEYNGSAGTTTVTATFRNEGTNYPIVVSMPVLTGANHLVLVKEGSRADLYLDAQFIGGIDLPFTVLDYGTSPSLQWLPEAAQVDEMAWYTRALNADEIALHHHIGSNPGTEPLTENELLTIFTDAGLSEPQSRVDSFNGSVFAWPTANGDSFYRYTDDADSKGLFFTGYLFDTPPEAVAALALAPHGNGATLVQSVTATTATTTYIGYIADGVPHGYKQYMSLTVAPFSYSTGVPY